MYKRWRHIGLYDVSSSAGLAGWPIRGCLPGLASSALVILVSSWACATLFRQRAITSRRFLSNVECCTQTLTGSRSDHAIRTRELSPLSEMSSSCHTGPISLKTENILRQAEKGSDFHGRLSPVHRGLKVPETAHGYGEDRHAMPCKSLWLLITMLKCVHTHTHALAHTRARTRTHTHAHARARAHAHTHTQTNKQTTTHKQNAPRTQRSAESCFDSHLLSPLPFCNATKRDWDVTISSGAPYYTEQQVHRMASHSVCQGGPLLLHVPTDSIS